MPRDYAHKLSRRKRRHRHSSIRLGFFSILGLSILVVGLIFSRHVFHQTHVIKREKLLNTPSKIKIAASSPKSPALPKFDFYTLLSKSSPDEILKLQNASHSEQSKPYSLQVAALTQQKAVLNLKERLQLLGFDVFVIERQNSAFRYRVNVGPYQTAAQAKSEQIRLSEDHFSSILVRRVSH